MFGDKYFPIDRLIIIGSLAWAQARALDCYGQYGWRASTRTMIRPRAGANYANNCLHSCVRLRSSRTNWAPLGAQQEPLFVGADLGVGWGRPIETPQWCGANQCQINCSLPMSKLMVTRLVRGSVSCLVAQDGQLCGLRAGWHRRAGFGGARFDPTGEWWDEGQARASLALGGGGRPLREPALPPTGLARQHAASPSGCTGRRSRTGGGR